MFAHQRGLYKTTRYIELFEFVDGFDIDRYSQKKTDTPSQIFKKRDLIKFTEQVTEYSEIFKRAPTVYATPNDEARLRRLFEDISEFIDNKVHLLI